MCNVLEINKSDRLGENVYSHNQVYISGVAE
jgi:hypothetical protein